MVIITHFSWKLYKNYVSKWLCAMCSLARTIVNERAKTKENVREAEKDEQKVNGHTNAAKSGLNSEQLFLGSYFDYLDWLWDKATTRIRNIMKIKHLTCTQKRTWDVIRNISNLLKILICRLVLFLKDNKAARKKIEKFERLFFGKLPKGWRCCLP